MPSGGSDAAWCRPVRGRHGGSRRRRLSVLGRASEVLARQVEYVAVVAESLVYLLLKVCSPVPCLWRNHHEVDVAVCVCLAAGDGAEHDHGLDIGCGFAHDAGQHLDRTGQRAQGSDGLVVLVDAVYAGATDGLGRDHADPFEISESLLHGTQAVSIDQRMDASPRQRRACAQQHREDRAAGSGHQAAEGFAEVHMN